MHISPEQLDALQELLNIGVGRAAGSLNQMSGKPIRLHIPFIQLEKIEDLSQEVQKAWAQGLHPDDRGQAEQTLQRALEGTEEFKSEFRMVWPDGSIHLISARGVGK